MCSATFRHAVTAEIAAVYTALCAGPNLRSRVTPDRDEDTTAALRELFDQFDTDGDVSMLANTTNSAPGHL